MEVWNGYHHDKKVPIIISVTYDEENDEYIVEVIRGFDMELTTFKPKYKPKDGLIHVSDLEKSVKLANNAVKALKSRAVRKK